MDDQKEQHQRTNESASQQHHSKTRSLYDLLIENKYAFGAIVLGILIINIYMRLGMVQYYGLFEPDGFFYYVVLQQTIANHYVVPQTIALSGFPPYHNSMGEAHGLIYVTALPYAILQYTGISPLDLMRLMPVLFGVLGALGAYFLVRYMAKSKVLGLLAMFFVSVSSGNIARTAALVYRGDSFVSVFLIFALIFMLRGMGKDDKRSKYINIAIASFILSLGLAIWNGSPFIVAVYIFALALFLMYGFIIADIKALYNSIIVAAGLLFTLLLERLWIYMGIANSVSLTGLDFVILYIPLIVGALLGYYIISKKDSFKIIAGTPYQRGAAVAVLAVLVLVVVFGVYGSRFNFIGSCTNAICATTQELQTPDFAFLFDSFYYQLAFFPIGLILFIFLADKIGEGHSTAHRIAGKLKANVNYGFLAMLAYLLVTGYLQYLAIRFNALVSIPIAVFSAYGVYAMGKLLFRIRLFNMPVRYVYYGILTVLLILTITFAAAESYASVQADGINPYFIQAMQWMSNNTAHNATVLALWPDGSVVEAVGQRQSYMDSVGGENASRIQGFADWLFSENLDTQYLYSIGKPDYLVVRAFWFQELGGIGTEGNGINLTGYGYTQMSSLTTSQGANSTTVYTLTGSGLRTELVETPSANTAIYAAYLGNANSSILDQIRHVMLFNTTSGRYVLFNATENKTLNYTLMIQYSGNQLNGATLIGPSLLYSNVFRFLVECTSSYCPYNDSNASMKLVYSNPDTKIFQISYSH